MKGHNLGCQEVSSTKRVFKWMLDKFVNLLWKSSIVNFLKVYYVLSWKGQWKDSVINFWKIQILNKWTCFFGLSEWVFKNFLL